MSKVEKPSYSEVVDAYEQLLRDYVKLYDGRPYMTRARDCYVVRKSTELLRRMRGQHP